MFPLSLSLRVSLLVSTLSDKDMLLNTLQSLLGPDETPIHQSAGLLFDILYPLLKCILFYIKIASIDYNRAL